jgi:hypothetical protein
MAQEGGEKKVWVEVKELAGLLKPFDVEEGMGMGLTREASPEVALKVGRGGERRRLGARPCVAAGAVRGNPASGRRRARD